jgi:hypothetical protein
MVPQSAMSACARAIRNTSSTAFRVLGGGIHPTLEKMSFWNKFWL